MRNGRKRPLLRSWVLSYVLVLLPMLLLCYTLYESNRSTLERNMLELQQAKLHRYQIVIQGDLNDLKLLATQLYANIQCSTVNSRSRTELRSTDYTIMSNIRGQIISGYNGIDYVEEMLVYLQRSGYGITSARVLPLEQLYDMTAEREALWSSLENLYALLRLRGSGGLIAEPQDGTVYYHVGLSKGSCILFNLNKEYLLDTYAVAQPEDEYVALVDAQGEPVYHSGEAFPVDTSCLASGIFPGNTSSWLVSSAKLEGFNYYVVSAISRTQLNATLLRQSTWSLLVIPVCTLACFLVIIYSLRRHYNPVAEVLRIANECGLNTDATHHEYTQLNTLLQKALDDRQKLLLREKQTRLQHEDAQLYAALFTQQAADTVSEHLARQQRPFAHPYWCYAELTLVDYADAQNDSQGDEAMISIARELILEMLEQNFDVVALFAHHRLLFLVGLPDCEDAHCLLLKSDLQKAISFLRNEYAAEFTCRITSVLAQTEDFSALSVQLMEQLAQMHRLSSGGSVQVYQQLNPTEAEVISTLSQLERSIRSGDCGNLRPDIVRLSQLAEQYYIQQTTSAEKSSSETIIRQQVIQLVQSSYYDPDLNVSAIAQRLGRNPDVLSRAFRQSMHMGPLDYIHSVRIQAATELLSTQPDMTVRRIAELCGYINIDSFNRAFKRITGTTPGKYREDKEKSISRSDNV